MKYLWAIYFLLLSSVLAVKPPYVVGTPPSDAGRGLIRVSENEIRHYSGKRTRQFLQSLDNGETWKLVDYPESYPSVTCLFNESPALVRNPNTGKILRVEPLYRAQNKSDGLYISEDGLDGKWHLVRGKDGNGLQLGGILRNPLWVDKGRRVIVPSHGGGCFTWYSDDQGMSWQRSNVINAPAHEVGGIHKGKRWNHGMVEATVIELKNRELWMVARTAQDQHYESFSKDFGKTWSQPEPSRFWGTITMPTFFRMQDGRMLMLWSNTTALPEKEGVNGRWEDVFTNRDTIHAAISEDDGKSWKGFRELILDEHRNRGDYGTHNGKGDRGKHQAEVVQLDKNRVLFSCGQHRNHRRLMIMDVRWLYEKERESNIAREGAKDWSTHQYIEKIVGHCSYNRTAGALVEDGALRVLRVEDPSLTNQNQGAVWNFPAGDSGLFTTTVRLEKGGAGMQITLNDRWFNPTDPTVEQFAIFTLNIDSEGKTPDGQLVLIPGKTQTLTIGWKKVAQGGIAGVKVDGKTLPIKLKAQHNCPNGLSYVHFYNPASEVDSHGFSIFNTAVKLR